MKRALFIGFCVFSALSTFANAQTLHDSSDWWSLNTGNFSPPAVTVANHELESGNFDVAGVVLCKSGFDAIMARVGKTRVIHRGDGDTGRVQLCYASATTSGSVHLVFEFGEDGSLFYLFSGGADWKGSKYCAQSKHVSENTSAASGLRLGLSPSDVRKILGPPDAMQADEFVYSRQFEKKRTPKEFDTMRQEYPQALSDEEAHRKFDFCAVEQYILARFSESKLVYLAVSVSGAE